jgi:hypothetical protein
MVEVMSADVLDWARDLSLIRSLVVGETACVASTGRKVLEFRCRRVDAAKA